MNDTFRGDNAALIKNIDSLLRLDAAGALVPHGVGGLARQLLAAAAFRLAAAPAVSFCAPDGTCSCQKFADDPATCERRFEAAAQVAPGEAAPDLLQDLHNELYRAQRTESVEVLRNSIGKARLLLARYREALTQHAPLQRATVADADRYRWLRSGVRTRQGLPANGERVIARDRLRYLMEFRFWGTPQELDAAIDAALQPTQGAPTNCRRDDGRCGICGGDWSVCGCDGMLRRAAAAREPDDSPLETGEGDAR